MPHPRSLLANALPVYRSSDRGGATQRVELKSPSTCNYSSTWNTVKCGVPQRSVLGLLLFIAYIDSELCTVDNSNNVIMYTDDRSIVTANNCYKESSRLHRASVTIKTLYYPTDAQIYNSQIKLELL